VDDHDTGFRGPSPEAPLGSIDGIPIQPCVGCGWCCYTQPCMEGYRHGATYGRCKFLVYHDERWWCEILESMPEGREKEQAKADMGGIGMGCPSTLFNEWRDKPPTPEEMDAFEKEHGR